MSDAPSPSSAAAPAWSFEAYKSGNGMGFKATLLLPTKEDAVAFAASLPKGLKAVGTSLSGLIDVGKGWWVLGYVSVQASMFPNKSTGAVNESAEKRWKAFRKLVKAEGWSLAYRSPYGNSLPESEAMAFGSPS